MRSDDIKKNLIKLLRNRNGNPTSIDDIYMLLEVSYRDRKALKEIINSMVSEGRIRNNGRRLVLLDKSSNRISPTPQKQIANPNLLEGVFDATPMAKNFSYAFVRTEQGDFFISSEDTLNAYHNDKVLIEPNFRKAGSKSGVIRKVIQRANQQFAGDLADNNGRLYFVCSNTKIHTWFEVSDSSDAHPGEKVILDVTNWGNILSGKYPIGKVVEILGKSGDPQVELLAVIRQYGLSLDFPPDVLREANSLETDITPNQLENRIDLRDLFTFTIDPISAKDFDDAISIKKHEHGWTLWVHIADVASYVKVGSCLFEEAVRRGNSFYFPKKVIPMLPEKISTQLCSLRPDEDKLAMTVVTEYNNTGKAIKQSLMESVIRSDNRLSYEEVDELFTGNETRFSSQLADALESARQLSNLLTKQRLDHGYIYFDLPEIEYEYDNEGFIRRLNLAEETESHKLIENFMLVANEYVAEQLTLKAPFTMYRIHENPDPRKLERLAELVSHYGLTLYDYGSPNLSIQALINSMPNSEYRAVFDRIILRSLKKASYSIEHIRHFGLGMDTYTHFTSPIRRICDLVIHHLCKMYLLRSVKTTLTRKQIHQYAQSATEQELQADAAERDIERIYSNAFMKKRIGDRFNGTVVSANANGLIVKLDEIPIIALLKQSEFRKYPWHFHDNEMRYVNARSGDYYQLMDKVKVTVIDVSDDIYLEVTNTSDSHTHIFALPSQQAQVHAKSKGAHNITRRSGNHIDSKQHSKKRGSKKMEERRKRNK